MEKNLLQEELEFFKTSRNEFLAKWKNEYALIRGQELFGTFVAKEDAIRRGYELFGNVPFLVKHIVEFDQPLFFTSSLIKLQ